MPAEVAEHAGERFGCAGRRFGVGSEVAVGLAKGGLAEGGDLLTPLIESCAAFDEGSVAIRLERRELRRERGRLDGEPVGRGAQGAGIDLEAPDSLGAAGTSDRSGEQLGVAVYDGDAVVAGERAGILWLRSSRKIVVGAAPVIAAISGIEWCFSMYCSCSQSRSIVKRGWRRGFGMPCATSSAWTALRSTW
jgi:hypothetical protein